MDTNAVTSSAALTELKSDLTRLSNTLHVIFDLMNTDMSQVGQAWQDGKYQEFVDGYKPQIQKCEDISVRYSDWCSRVLDPTIENVIAVEKTDVGGGGSSVGVANSSSIVGGGTAAAVGGAGIASGFNFGVNNTPKPSTNAVPISNGCGSENSTLSKLGARIAKPIDAKQTGTSEAFQNASCDQHDKDYYNGVPKEQADREFEQRSPIMGAAVRGDMGTAFDRAFGTEETKTSSKMWNRFGGSSIDEGIQKTADESYANAQKDREISQRLQSTWEEEHQQSLDTENYRVDVAEGGFSSL